MNLQDIRLVTFDVFGTLLNWKRFVESLYPGKYGDFLKESELRQRVENPEQPYASLLHSVAATFGAIDTRKLEFFSKHIGLAPMFQDARALAALQQSVLVGCISNSDYMHQCDVQRNLGIVWDAVYLSEISGHYKPAMQMWKWAVEQVESEFGLRPAQWLHVSAFLDYDLQPAQELGINVGFLPRPGGTDPHLVAGRDGVLPISDLFELVRMIQQAQGSPVVYRVDCDTRSKEEAEDFRRWIQYEHGDDLLRVEGCTSYQMVALSDLSTRCEYTFKGEAHLNKYFSGHATVLRKKAIERFGEGSLNYTRSVSPLVQTCSDRRSLLGGS